MEDKVTIDKNRIHQARMFQKDSDVIDDAFIVAVPKYNFDPYVYDWIASFETAEAAEAYAMKIENSIVVYNARF